MRDPYSLEAEQGVLGAMLIDPSLIDVLTEDLAATDFNWPDNADIFRAIVDLHSSQQGVDFLTVSEIIGTLSDGSNAIAYVGEIQRGTPSVANAKAYAKIVKERSLDRRLIQVAATIHEIAHSSTDTPDKIAQAQTEVLAVDGSSNSADVVSAWDVLVEHMPVLERREEMKGELDGLSTGLPDLDEMLQGLKPEQLIIIAGRPAMGKAQPLGAKVLLANGEFTTIGEIATGDQLASVDGRQSVVVGVYPQGVRPIYRVTMADGRSVEADADHLWTINSSKFTGDKTLTTLELQQMLDRARYQGRVTLKPHGGDFGREADFGVDPWLLGFLLGDGCLRKTVRFSASEQYILDRVAVASGMVPRYVSCYDYALTTERGQINPLLESIRSLGLIGKYSSQKFVPEIVFSCSKEIRQGVLAGLIESDGWCEKANSLMFASSSEQLRDDVAELVKSLGGYCSKTTKGGRFYSKDGERHDCLDSYVACIKMDNLSDFIRSPRILKNIKPRRLPSSPAVVSVEYVRQDKAVCIKVSHPSELYITDGYLVTHNTTLAMNIAAHAGIRQSKKVQVFSLEMSNGQLMDRFLAAEGRVPLQDIKSGRGFAGENGLKLTAAAGKIRDSGLVMSDRAGLSMSRIRSIARRQKLRAGLDLIIIDYLQLLDEEGGSGNRTEAVSAMSRGAKLMARELQVPVIMLSQLNRSLESRPNKRPMCSDLRESGAIEQDADIILFVYRDEIYHPDSEYKGVAEIIIGKGRDIETGTVRSCFNGQYSRFDPLAPGWIEPEYKQDKPKRRGMD